MRTDRDPSHITRPAEAANTDTVTKAGTDYNRVAQEIVRDVIEAVSGPLDGRVKVSVSVDPPLLTLEHTAKSPKGNEHVFRYEMDLAGKKLSPGPLPELDKTSHISFPAGPYTESMITSMQDAFRCACIHDPVLYGRFNRKELRLEDYQTEAVSGALSDLEESGRALLVLGTGGGKTQIAFEIAAAELKRAPVLEDAVVVFVVNNNVILGEAGDKFVERFNDVFSKSHAHGGRKDITGNVVFTTPGTLLGDKRLETLMSTKKQVLFIFDEVHHVVATQPDEIIKRAVAVAKESSVDVRFLGMTATETRPDLKSVLAYFNNHITFDQPAAALTARGFLAPFKYHAHDQWLYANNKPPSIIHPTDDLAAERRRILNSSAAFVHIENALDQHVRDREDRRTLIVAPSVGLAGEFKGYLEKNPDYKGRVVRLTAEDRQADPERFKDTYDAWKKGKWPEGSRFSNEPVPEIVVAVDLFKEGADAPAVRTIINWGDTNSLIVFLQTLGRGLRPDPFKTNLDVIDIAGTFRKVHLLQWLGNASDRREPDKEGPEVPRVWDTDKDVSRDLRALCELSPEVSHSVQAFMADIASGIIRRYPGYHYSAIPAQELEKLHAYIGERCGYETRAEFDQALAKIARELVGNSSLDTARESRGKLMGAFFTHDEFSAADAQKLDPDERALLIHTHLSQTMQTLEPELKATHIAKVFPELSEETFNSLRVVGGNLMTLRLRHFRCNPGKMIEVLKSEVIEKGGLSHDIMAEAVLTDWARRPDEVSLAFSSLEGRSAKRAGLAEDVPFEWEQRAVLLAYLNHPAIKGKLEESDFKLPRKQFENLLAVRGLVTIRADEFSSDSWRFVSSKLDELSKALEANNQSAIDRAAGASGALLEEMLRGMFLEETLVNKYRFEGLEKIASAIAPAAASNEKVAQVHSLLNEVLDRITGREVSVLASAPGLALMTEQRPESKFYSFTIESDNRAVVHGGFAIQTDLLRPHIMLPESDLSRVNSMYDKLPPIAQRDLLVTLSRHIEKISQRVGTQKVGASTEEEGEVISPVVIVPSLSVHSPKNFVNDLRDCLLSETSLNVLVCGDRVNPVAGAARNLESSISNALMSRVGEVTEDSLKDQRNKRGTGSDGSIQKAMLHAYDVLLFARTRIAPNVAQWTKLFEEHDVHGESLKHVEAARAPLDRLLDPGCTVSKKRLPDLETYASLLKAVSASGGFSRDSALLLGTWAAWDSAPLGAYELRGSPLRDLNLDVRLFIVRLSQALEQGVEIPSAHRDSIREILTTLFESTHGRSLSEVFALKGVPYDRQKETVAAFKEKMKEISTTIPTLHAGGASAESVPSSTRIRESKHPYFNADKEAVVFLSGTKKKPMMHFEPECKILTEDMGKKKKRELPIGPVTANTVNDSIGDIRYAACCPNCKTPSPFDWEHYRDEVEPRFVWDDDKSVMLPAAKVS